MTSLEQLTAVTGSRFNIHKVGVGLIVILKGSLNASLLITGHAPNVPVYMLPCLLHANDQNHIDDIGDSALPHLKNTQIGSQCMMLCEVNFILVHVVIFAHISLNVHFVCGVASK